MKRGREVVREGEERERGGIDREAETGFSTPVRGQQQQQHHVTLWLLATPPHTQPVCHRFKSKLGLKKERKKTKTKQQNN